MAKTPEELASTMYEAVTESRVRVQKLASETNTDSVADYQRASLALLTEIHQMVGIIAVAALAAAYR